jgi:hypothetical protein
VVEKTIKIVTKVIHSGDRRSFFVCYYEGVGGKCYGSQEFDSDTPQDFPMERGGVKLVPEKHIDWEIQFYIDEVLWLVFDLKGNALDYQQVAMAPARRIWESLQYIGFKSSVS